VDKERLIIRQGRNTPGSSSSARKIVNSDLFSPTLVIWGGGGVGELFKGCRPEEGWRLTRGTWGTSFGKGGLARARTEGHVVGGRALERSQKIFEYPTKKKEYFWNGNVGNRHAAAISRLDIREWGELSNHKNEERKENPKKYVGEGRDPWNRGPGLTLEWPAAFCLHRKGPPTSVTWGMTKRYLASERENGQPKKSKKMGTSAPARAARVPKSKKKAGKKKTQLHQRRQKLSIKKTGTFKD